MTFGGYTDGQTKETVDGLMSTGDVGHFDAGGRLHVDGRDDDMIVSGGENVPQRGRGPPGPRAYVRARTARVSPPAAATPTAAPKMKPSGPDAAGGPA